MLLLSHSEATQLNMFLGHTGHSWGEAVCRMGFKCRFKGPENNHFFHSELPMERQTDGQGQVRAGHCQLGPGQHTHNRQFTPCLRPETMGSVINSKNIV